MEGQLNPVRRLELGERQLQRSELASARAGARGSRTRRVECAGVGRPGIDRRAFSAVSTTRLPCANGGCVARGCAHRGDRAAGQTRRTRSRAPESWTRRCCQMTPRSCRPDTHDATCHRLDPRAAARCDSAFLFIDTPASRHAAPRLRSRSCARTSGGVSGRRLRVSLQKSS
jgi:hypothetical protein